ncbi:hypothetical protein BDW42DRAFT_201013 [Aspergillus taichungensis]|uniref:HypA-like protein n=1 Tax=Aspergillus taichungensis TaxID=482145 RepID=A0A2J5HUL6_9EURO|nr:hypothetical protein BDW42DRAFT_201013 [Aspergillus taichungensis]
MTFANIRLPTDPRPTGIFEVRPFSAECAAKTAELIKTNNERYHLLIHNAGVHNHILHHLLALYAMGATPAQLDKAFLRGTISQKPAAAPNSQRVRNFGDPSQFLACVGDGRYYNDYCAFFQEEVERNGMAQTAKEYLFKGDERGEEMFRRFFGGYLHSPIHLGYAIEFDQPLIAAEAFALTSVHSSSYGETLHMIEKAVQSAPPAPGRSLIDIQQDIYSNRNIRNAMDYDDVDKLHQSVVPNAEDDVVKLVGQWRVHPDELDIRVAELLNTFTYLAASAQRPDKQIRFDFFLMHVITSSSFAPVLTRTSWIPKPTRARILEWLGRAALLIYIESGAPLPRPEEIANYKPLHSSGWSELFHRACEYEDDGHLVKLIRGIRTGAVLAGPYADRGEFPLKGEREFLVIAHMAMDGAEKFQSESVEQEVDQVNETSIMGQILPRDIMRVVARWPRHVGYDEAWYHVPGREGLGTKARI